MGRSFEELEVWKAGCRIAVAVISEMKDCKIFVLRDQMIRSAVSISSNISEGAERFSDKEFRRFLSIALGSAAELRTQVYISRESDVLGKETADKWLRELKSISKMLQALTKSLQC